MKFEEVLRLIREEDKKLEDFEHQVLSSGVWAQFSNETFTTWENLIKKEFRLKPQKEKVKRYQVLYYRNPFYTGGKKIFKASEEKYLNEKDFLDQNSGCHIIFDSLILESGKDDE